MVSVTREQPKPTPLVRMRRGASAAVIESFFGGISALSRYGPHRELGPLVVPVPDRAASGQVDETSFHIDADLDVESREEQVLASEPADVHADHPLAVVNGSPQAHARSEEDELFRTRFDNTLNFLADPE